MVDKTPDPTSKPQANSPQSSEAPSANAPKKGNVFARPMTFLGMKFTGDEAQKLWNIIIQNINNAIQKAQDRAMKALEKLKKSATGDESSDD